jgi:hypothetical protein
MRRCLAFVSCIVVLAAAGRPAAAASATSLLERAQAAIARGDVDPARDLAPLVAELRTAGGGKRETLISGIAELGRYDGPSPAAVKAYLQREAPPALIAIARGKASWTVRGDAIMALRTLNASDEFFDEAIAVAQADTSKEAGFIRSRGELLQGWKRSRPQPPVSAAVAVPADPARERSALAFLRQRSLGVSVSQLRTSAMGGRADEVQALLDAGVSADAPGFAGSMLGTAAGLGCSASPGDVQARADTVRLLIQRGADVKAKDELGNTPLLTAAMHCPLPVVQVMVEAGAPLDAVNQQGVSPLSTAFLGNNWEVARYLVGKGARLSQKAVDLVFFELPTEPEKRDLIRRATAK